MRASYSLPLIALVAAGSALAQPIQRGNRLPPAPTASAAQTSVATAPPPPNPAPPPTAGGATAMPATPIAATPSTIDFGAVWNGDAPVRKTFTIANVPQSGPFTVALAGKSPFRIVQVRVTGFPPPGNPSRALARGARGTTSPPGSAANATATSQSLKANVVAAPFTANADAQDTIHVTVEFAPKFSFEEVAGPKSAHVVATALRWKTDVLATGTFNGLRLGMS